MVNEPKVPHSKKNVISLFPGTNETFLV